MESLAEAPAPIDWPEIAFRLGVLAALVVAAGVLIVLVRRSVRNEGPGREPAFTLEDLREMRDRGDLTEVEYQAARTAALGQAAGGLSDKPPPNRHGT